MVGCYQTCRTIRKLCRGSALPLPPYASIVCDQLEARLRDVAGRVTSELARQRQHGNYHSFIPSQRLAAAPWLASSSSHQKSTQVSGSIDLNLLARQTESTLLVKFYGSLIRGGDR